MTTREEQRLGSVVEVDNQADGAGRLLDGEGLVTLVGRGVGVEEATKETAADVGAVISSVVTDTHTQNIEIVELSNDAGNIISRPSLVLLVAHVEFTPSGGILAEVGGGDLTLRGSPATLGVVIDGDVLDGALGQGKLQSSVGLPETVHLAVGAIGVPEENIERLVVGTFETNYVLVRAGISLVNQGDVATPGATDVALVGPVLLARVGALG